MMRQDDIDTISYMLSNPDTMNGPHVPIKDENGSICLLDNDGCQVVMMAEEDWEDFLEKTGGEFLVYGSVL